MYDKAASGSSTKSPEGIGDAGNSGGGKDSGTASCPCGRSRVAFVLGVVYDVGFPSPGAFIRHCF